MLAVYGINFFAVRIVYEKKKKKETTKLKLMEHSVCLSFRENLRVIGKGKMALIPAWHQEE